MLPIKEHRIIDRGRGPEIEGTRITVYDIMDYLKDDWHHTAIASWLRLSSFQVLAVIKYIEEHREEVEAEYREILAREAKGNPPEIQAKIAESHKKLQAWMEEIRNRKNQENGRARNHGGQEQ